MKHPPITRALLAKTMRKNVEMARVLYENPGYRGDHLKWINTAIQWSVIVALVERTTASEIRALARHAADAIDTATSQTGKGRGAP